MSIIVEWVKYEHLDREGQPFIIYALVCPMTLDVKYVGQTGDLEARMHKHWPSAHRGRMRDWLLSLGEQRPIAVVLERGVNRPLRLRIKDGNKNRWQHTWFSTVRETIWQVRHRRTILNTVRVESAWIEKALGNPPLPWDEGYEYERTEVPGGGYCIAPIERAATSTMKGGGAAAVRAYYKALRTKGVGASTS